MDFSFSEEQLQFRQAVRDFLRKEVTPEWLRAHWETESGRSDALWARLAELGLTGFTVPEAANGLGMSELDFILLARECGYVALPEPLSHTALVAVPLLCAIGGELAAEWLPRVASGQARVAVGLEQNSLVEDAHVADLLLLQREGEFHALAPGAVRLRRNESVDPSRRLYEVEIAAPRPVGGAAGLADFALDRGALACAAEALGLAQRMLDLAVAHSSGRQQFGKPIGSFQAVKHPLASVAVRLEYAAAPVYRAAYAAAHRLPGLPVNVSHAKLAACEAASLAARSCIQAHGAMGYTWEADPHIFMKRAWALANTWGDSGFHKARLGEFIFADDAPLGAGNTFSAAAGAEPGAGKSAIMR